MANQNKVEGPKVMRYLNDFRKEISLIKVRSFYANHLCKRQCLKKDLLGNNQECEQACDDWLVSFHNNKNLLQSKIDTNLQAVSHEGMDDAQKRDYEKYVALTKLNMGEMLRELNGALKTKIAECKKD